jgi:hypothetical protein
VKDEKKEKTDENYLIEFSLDEKKEGENSIVIQTHRCYEHVEKSSVIDTRQYFIKRTNDYISCFYS